MKRTLSLLEVGRGSKRIEKFTGWKNRWRKKHLVKIFFATQAPFIMQQPIFVLNCEKWGKDEGLRSDYFCCVSSSMFFTLCMLVGFDLLLFHVLLKSSLQSRCFFLKMLTMDFWKKGNIKRMDFASCFQPIIFYVETNPKTQQNARMLN